MRLADAAQEYARQASKLKLELGKKYVCISSDKSVAVKVVAELARRGIFVKSQSEAKALGPDVAGGTRRSTKTLAGM